MPPVSESVLTQIDKSKLPVHVAIIMDGNGRWARKRHLPRIFGHRAGTKVVHEIVEAAGKVGIKVLTLYAFSTENWLRPQMEVGGLMRLLKQNLRNERKSLAKNNVRFETIGDISKLPADVQAEINATKEFLKANTGLLLVLALNYGGRQEIVRACNAAIKEGHKTVSEGLIAKHLFTGALPDPDLLIRTSGENRVSNFLLWQIAYAEFYITPILWPDFHSHQFYEAILDYQKRERRFGALT